jgi:UDP-glucose 4-epimerase
MSYLITGGAGFIGSHLVDYLLESGEEVTVLDNLSAGSMSNLEQWKESEEFRFIKGDLLDSQAIDKALEGCGIVYHLAANPEVRTSKAKPCDHFKQNVEATYNLLEAIRDKGDIETLVFSSTSTVYGEPNVIPTPETYAPLKPISHYGASKLAAEALITSYASMYGFHTIIYRMANVVGPRSNHGIIFDFIEKLRRNLEELQVLGDGSQSKSYLHIEDCIRGIIHGAEKAGRKVEILNIGSEDRVDVLSIAGIVTQEMGLNDVRINLTGGVDGGRGWKGDVKIMQLDTSKIRSLGWCPLLSSREAVRKTAHSLVQELLSTIS